MLTSPPARWVAGTAGLCVVLALAAWFALVAPARAEAADIADRTAAAQQQNDMTQLRTAQLKAQFATLPQKQGELATLVGQMPVTADVPRFVRTLEALAATSGVRLDTVTPAAGQSLDATPAAATPGAAATAPAAKAAPAGGMDVVAVPITIVVTGPYFKTVTFLKGLQTGQRAFLVNGLQVTVKGSDVTATVRGQIFVLPGAAQALAQAGGPAAAPAPSASPIR